MIPIHLETQLIPPGTQVWKPEECVFIPKEERPSPTFLSSPGLIQEFECALAFYLPEAEKQFTPQADNITVSPEENGDLPELGIVAGLTTQTIFMIVGASDNSDITHGHRHRGSWAVEFMGDGNYVDLEAYVKNIYEDACAIINGKFDPRIKNPRIIDLRIDRGYNPEEKSPYPIEFLTLWRVETSRDWETQINEVEAFHYQGPGKTVLLQKPADPSEALPCGFCGKTPHVTPSPVEGAHPSHDLIRCPDNNCPGGKGSVSREIWQTRTT